MAEYKRKADGTYVHESTRSDEAERYWFNAEDPTDSLWAVVRGLRNKQTWKRRSDELALTLTCDMRYVGYHAKTTNYNMQEVIESRLGANVVRPIIRVLDAKIARRRSRPYVVTNGASWRQRNAARNLERWLLGKLRDIKFDAELAPTLRMQTLTYGTGCIRVYGDEKLGAQAEVIPADEIIIDDSEARYGAPRNLYFVRAVDVGVLKAQYPDKKAIIDKANEDYSVSQEWASNVGAWDLDTNISNLAIVIEAYHLPSGPDTGDGRYDVVCSAGPLHSSEWKRDHFPCVWMRRERRPRGFWGIGVPEDVAAIQIELSRSSLARQEMIETLAMPYWLIERGMKIMKSRISAIIGRIVEWTPTGSGNKPELVANNAVPQELWVHDDNLKRNAFESTGVSQLSAQMLKPAGLNSGKALRAYSEFESELLTGIMNEYDNVILNLCELLIEEQVELGDAVHGQEVSYVGNGEIESIKWDKKLLKDLKYIIEILPASALASTLSARLEDVYDLRDLGVVTDPDELMDYLDLPDARRMQRKHLANEQLLDKVIEYRIIENGEWVEPEPTWDLEAAMDKALWAADALELYEDAPQDRIELLRQFILNCQLLLDRAAEAQAQAQMAAGMSPTGDMNGPESAIASPDAAGPGALPEGGGDASLGAGPGPGAIPGGPNVPSGGGL